MEVILNTSARLFNFSFFVKGGLVTVQVPPGTVRVKKAHITELRKLKMFTTLEDDHILAVGVKGSDEVPEAKELAKEAKKLGKTMDLEDL